MNKAQIFNIMDWHIELLKRGFKFLESSTRTYGNGKLTGSIVKDSEEIFCPFIRADDDARPNGNFQKIKLRDLNDLDKYLI